MVSGLELIALLPDSVRGLVLEGAGKLADAAMELGVEGGVRGMLRRLSGGERGRVEGAFASAIAVAMLEYPQLDSVGFTRWLRRPEVSRAFLNVVAEPAVDPDPGEWERLLDASEFDPVTFPVSLPVLAAALRANFLAALYHDPATRGLWNALIQEQQLAEYRTGRHLIRRVHDSVQRLEDLLSPASSSPSAPRVARRLPPGFVPRSGELRAIRQRVLGPFAGPSAVIALQGPGGFGKTTLALAVCNDEAVRREFADGMIWVELGERPDVRARLEEVYAALTEKRPRFVSVDDAANAVAAALDAKRVLVVVDDVWAPEHLEPFLRGGPRVVRLVTTRHAVVVRAAGLTEPVDVGRMVLSEAVELLASQAGVNARRESLVPFARRVGEWPLLLALAGAALRDRLRRGEALAGALRRLDEDLKHDGPATFDRHDSTARALAVERTVGASLGLLEARERSRLLRLAVFPEEEDVPSTAVAALWAMPVRQAERLLERFDDLSLLRYEAGVEHGSARLHGVLREHFARLLRMVEPPKRVHRRLLEAWGDMRASADPYVLRRAAYHMAEAGRENALRELLFDPAWLRAKLLAGQVDSLLADYTYLAGEDVRLVWEALRLSAHVLERDPSQLASQLCGRLAASESPAVRRLLDAVRQEVAGTWLRPVRSSLARPSGPLLRTLEGARTDGRTLEPLRDGRVLLRRRDGTLQVLDAATGTSPETLAARPAATEVLEPFGSGGLLSGSRDGIVTAWNAETGEVLWRRKGHHQDVSAIAACADGRFAFSGSTDGSLTRWELETGEEMHLAGGRAVRALAVSPDGRLAAVASVFGYVRVVDLETDTTLYGFGGEEEIYAMAFTPGGTRVIGGSEDRWAGVWDVESGELLCSLPVFSNHVSTAALLMHGSRAVVSIAGGLRMWDVERDAAELSLGAHAGYVRSLAVLGDTGLVSLGEEGTLKVWDVARLESMDGYTRTCTVAALDDGRTISHAEDGTVTVWDPATGTALRTLRLPPDSEVPSFSADGRRLVWHRADPFDRAPISVWDLETRRNIFATERDHANWAVVSGDGRHLFGWSLFGALTLWGLETSARVVLLQETGTQPRAQSVSKDGRRALWALEDGSLMLWDADSGVRTLDVHRSAVYVLAMTADGRWGVSAAGGSVMIWNLDTGQATATFAMPGERIFALSVSDDGRRVASTGKGRVLRVWDAVTGETLGVFWGDAEFRAVAISPDGSRIVAADWQGGLHILLLETSQDRTG